ncbi:hypothetical protein [Rhodococcoides kyotonense]|uniref:Putative hemin transport protein n=1 Tax=Rhodococcoides kyotonense TaxID=398843 RepID=A0A239IFF4_9NOCA|nr:hypothetical protein [Rhodococcus kyotonensis]SNS92269.1 putative hemin transport protein [Rhodococcus kyotonensis]
MPTPPSEGGGGDEQNRPNPGPSAMPAGASRPCGRHSECRCAAALPTSSRKTDLESLLDKPDFAGEMIGGGAAGVTEFLPLLEESVAITVSGPAVMNDVGHYEPPTVMGGPIRTSKSRISLRLNLSRLNCAVATEPDQYLPPTLRLFDTSGFAAHATYLTPRSDRIAFEALRQLTTPPVTDPFEVPASPSTPEQALAVWSGADQIEQFDSILGDGGVTRHAALPSLSSLRYRQIDPTRISGALEHLAYLELPMTMVTVGAGCMQIHHDHLIAARLSGGNLTLASGMCRMMVDLAHVTSCWATVTSGVWGPTSSIEMYDRRGHCSVVFTQTGATDAVVAGVWEEVVASL